MKHKIITTLFIVIIVALLMAIGYVSSSIFNKPTSVAPESDLAATHTISGVPYWGMYRGSKLTTSLASASYSILEYWGDNRFSLDGVATKFPYSFRSTVGEQRDFKDVDNFFSSLGYTVANQDYESILQIKRSVIQDIPVIVFGQRLNKTAPEYLRHTQLVIGYSDIDQAFIIHDDLYGNNYPLSYSDFEQLIVAEETVVQTIVPGPGMADVLNPETTPDPYPSRLGIMNSPAVQDAIIFWKDASYNSARAQTVTEYQLAAEKWETLLASPGFDLLHPAGKMFASNNLAEIYTHKLKEHEKAIAVLENTTIPQLDFDFNEAFGEWERYSTDMYSNPWIYTTPWLTLGIASLQIGDNEKAANAFNQASAIDPENIVPIVFKERIQNNLNDTEAVQSFIDRYLEEV